MKQIIMTVFALIGICVMTAIGTAIFLEGLNWVERWKWRRARIIIQRRLTKERDMHIEPDLPQHYKDELARRETQRFIQWIVGWVIAIAVVAALIYYFGGEGGRDVGSEVLSRDGYAMRDHCRDAGRIAIVCVHLSRA